MTQSVQINGKRLIAACAPVLDEPAAGLLKQLAALHMKGPALHPGSIIDFGWVPLQIQCDGDDWIVCEPDFGAEPLRWRPKVDVTLDTLDRQLALVRRLGLLPSPARWDQTVLVAPGADAAASLFFERSPPADAHDSGWYIGVDLPGVEPDRRQADRFSVGELAVARPAWAGLFALPVGYLAFFRNGRVCEVLDPSDREIFRAPDSGAGGPVQ